MDSIPRLLVSRPVSACSRCRNAKVRCDGKLPACTACEKAGKAEECSSANDDIARGKERSYVASLESRIEALEKKLSKSKRHNDALSPDMAGESHRPALTHSLRKRQINQIKEASDVDELVSDFGFLSVNATSRDFHGFAKDMSFARLVISTSTVEPVPQFSMTPLPSRQVSASLVEQCIKEVFVFYPVLSRTSIFGSLELAYQHNGFFCAPGDHWNIRMVLAISLLTQSRVKGDIEYMEAMKHVSSALEQSEYVLQPGTIAAVQAVLLLVLYSLLDPCHFNCWYLIGVASRLMVDIGLHEDLPKEVNVSEKGLEHRKRTFTCVYTLDRIISMSYLRAFSFSDHSTNVGLPLKRTSTLMMFEANLQGATPSAEVDPGLELFQLREIESCWYQKLFASDRSAKEKPWQTRADAVNQMQKHISKLPTGFPRELRNVMHLEMLYCTILCIWPPNTHVNLDGEGITRIWSGTIEYMRIAALVCDTAQCMSGEAVRALYIGYCLIDILQKYDTFIFDAANPSETPPPSPPGSDERENLPNQYDPGGLVLHRQDQQADESSPIKSSQGSPQHPHTTGKLQMINDSINALLELKHILKVLGRRFGLAMEQDFNAKSEAVFRKLYDMRAGQLR